MARNIRHKLNKMNEGNYIIYIVWTVTATDMLLEECSVADDDYHFPSQVSGSNAINEHSVPEHSHTGETSCCREHTFHTPTTLQQQFVRCPCDTLAPSRLGVTIFRHSICV